MDASVPISDDFTPMNASSKWANIGRTRAALGWRWSVYLKMLQNSAKKAWEGRHQTLDEKDNENQSVRDVNLPRASHLELGQTPFIICPTHEVSNLVQHLGVDDS